MAKLPRYVQQRVVPTGAITYRYNPPQKWVDAGIVDRSELPTDKREMKVEANRRNKLIDDYREEHAKSVRLTERSTVNELVNFFYQSNDFNALRDTTKVDYRYCLSELCTVLGNTRYRDVTSKVAKMHYEEWVKRGIHFANHIATAASRVFNFAIDMEEATFNPFGNIKRKSAPQRKTVWDHDHVITFLNTAYTKFEWRNVGLIIQMTYEWGQRLGDMRKLRWTSLDLDSKMLHLKQSKRRAEVFLPISDDLSEMLIEQKETFGFQDYVAPHPRPSGGQYHAYAMERLSKTGRDIMREAGLPEELRLMDLRRTVVTQMVDSGVPLPQIMSVTGHANVASVQPYMKHTYDSACSALTRRNGHVKLNEVNIESD